MNGCRIPGTPLVVDFWKTKELPPRMMFFLTHLHADHTSGLSSSWPYKIHCTGLTGELLKKKFGIDPKLVVELPLEQPKLLHVVSPRSHNSVSITVTAIDANHCPGASMFLFEGYFGRILYTGDFRYSADMVMNPCLNNSRSVDILYLDNTYCDPSCLFPTREAAREEIVSMMESYSGSSVYIGLHNLGKEDLLVYLASRFQSYVSVSQDRMEVLKVLGMPNVFTCSTEEWIRVVPFHLLAKNYIADVRDGHALGILPTCLYVGSGAITPPPHVKVVPYSDHSSYEELRMFVDLIKPRSVCPLVKNFTGEKAAIRQLRNNMKRFDDLLDKAGPTSYAVPNAVKELLSAHSTASTSSRSSSTRTPKHQHFISRRPRAKALGVRFVSPQKRIVDEREVEEEEDKSEESGEEEEVEGDVQIEDSESEEESIEDTVRVNKKRKNIVEHISVKKQLEKRSEVVQECVEDDGLKECGRLVDLASVSTENQQSWWVPVEQTTCSRTVPLDKLYLKNPKWGMKAVLDQSPPTNKSCPSLVEEWDHYCHQDQHEEIHEQIVCALEGVTRCALCRSGLEAMCGTLHDIQTCRCSSCLSGIWHLFQPTLHNL